jgi:peptidoglycan biosynthesis protein MviN/MurJ (putative lipid II flippase)
LNAEKIYGRVELNSLLNGIISIGLLIAIGKEIGAWVLLISLLAGRIVEFFISFLLLYRIGYRHQWCWSTDDFNFRRLFIMLIPTSGYVAATQLYIFTLTHFASFLPEGIFSLFKYVGQLGQKISSMVIDPLSSVFFSEFSHKLKETIESLNKFVQKPFIFILIISWSSLLACMLAGLDFLQVLWSEKSLKTYQFDYCELALILSFASYAIGNPSQLFRKAAISLGGAQRLYSGWIITQIISAALAGMIIPKFGQQGLLWISLINMGLIAMVSMATAHWKGIKFASILQSNEISKFLSYFICLAALTASLKYFIPALPPLASAIIKLGLFGILFISMVSLFFRNEVLSRIPQLKKIRNPFFNRPA